MVQILHISDLHCTSPYAGGSHKAIIDAIVSRLEGPLRPDIIVASGDFTFKGNPDGFQEARRFLVKLSKELHIATRELLICPGNHDLVLGNKALQDYSLFASSLIGDPSCAFGGPSSRAVCKKSIKDAEFWLLNTVYSLTPDYGLFDASLFRKLLSKSPHDGKSARICIMHHHLVNQFRTDRSVLRNAYDLLELLDEHNFHLVLHGHQHSRQTLSAGRCCFLSSGVRALNFRDGGVNCGFALVKAEHGRNAQLLDFILDRSGERFVARRVD